jgi:hypothetical protein
MVPNRNVLVVKKELFRMVFVLSVNQNHKQKYWSQTIIYCLWFFVFWVLSCCVVAVWYYFVCGDVAKIIKIKFSKSWRDKLRKTFQKQSSIINWIKLWIFLIKKNPITFKMRRCQVKKQKSLEDQLEMVFIKRIRTKKVTYSNRPNKTNLVYKNSKIPWIWNRKRKQNK